VNQISAVINQPHRFRLGETGPVASCDEGHATAMAGRSAGSLEDAVKLPIGMVVSELIGSSDNLRKRESIMPLNALQEGGEMLTHRNGKYLSRVILVSLGVHKKDGQVLEVDVLLCNSSLVESAAEVDQDLKADTAPFLFGPRSQELQPGLMDVVIIQFRFLLGGLFGDDLPSQDISFGNTLPNGLFHDEAEEFDLGPRGIMGGTGLLAPSHVLVSVFVLELSGVPDLLGEKPALQIAPEMMSALARLDFQVMALDVGRNPLSKIIAPIRANHRLFFALLGGLLERGRSFFGVINPKLEILSHPNPCFQIAIPQVPERASVALGQVSHKSDSGTQGDKSQVFCGFLKCSNTEDHVLSTQGEILPLHHGAIYLSVDQLFTTEGDTRGTSPCGVVADSRYEHAERVTAAQVLTHALPLCPH